MEIIERIYQTLSEKDKKAYELCEKLNIRTSTMSTWKARTNDPPAKYMKTIADFLGVSLDYLMTGQEAPVRKTTTPEEDELLALFRSLPEPKKYEFVGELKGFLKAYTESQKYLDEEKDYQFRMVSALWPLLRQEKCLCQMLPSTLNWHVLRKRQGMSAPPCFSTFLHSVTVSTPVPRITLMVPLQKSGCCRTGSHCRISFYSA